MHNGNLNDTRCDDQKKTNETIHFKGKNLGELSQENNPLYQFEIYSQEYQFVVNLTKLPNWVLKSSNFFDLDLFSHEPRVHALIFSIFDS